MSMKFYESSLSFHFCMHFCTFGVDKCYEVSAFLEIYKQIVILKVYVYLIV